MATALKLFIGFNPCLFIQIPFDTEVFQRFKTNPFYSIPLSLISNTFCLRLSPRNYMSICYKSKKQECCEFQCLGFSTKLNKGCVSEEIIFVFEKKILRTRSIPGFLVWLWQTVLEDCHSHEPRYLSPWRSAPARHSFHPAAGAFWKYLVRT